MQRKNGKVVLYLKLGVAESRRLPRFSRMNFTVRKDLVQEPSIIP